MARVHNQLLAFVQCDLVYLTRCRKSSKSAACEMVISPVGWSESPLYPRGDGEGMAGPCEEGVSLGDLPIGCAIEVENREGCIW